MEIGLMQVDMHYYATYAMARAAGIPPKDANIIAYSAQFVDDSTKEDSKDHDDQGMMWGVATAHHARDCPKNAVIDLSEQRRVWVPFHFIPGGQGKTLEEKLICTKDSAIVNELFSNHISTALDKKAFGLHLLGIVSHVYMDTFSHYGFSGISSAYNSIVNDSIKLITKLPDDIENYVLKKAKRFFKKFSNSIISLALESFSRSLGHGAVSTYPDRPYLHWEFKYEKSGTGDNRITDRNNPQTFLEGCQKLHSHLSNFAKQYYNQSNDIVPFEEMSDRIEKILNHFGKKAKRSAKWKEFIQSTFQDNDPNYNHEDWEQQRKSFERADHSAENLKLDLYKYHQAATYHRYYVLKDLLPKHGIMAY